MRSASTAMQAHLAGQTTTLATLWQIIRTDGQVFGFTDHDVDITLDGLTYQAATGFTPTAIETGSDLSVDNLEVQGILDPQTITDESLSTGVWDYAKVNVYLVNWADPSMGKVWHRSGNLGEAKTTRLAFFSELRGLFQHLQQNVGRIYIGLCDANLGDARCKLNLAPFTFTGIVETVSSRKAFSDSGRGEVADYFNNGLLTFNTGLNAGLSMEVKTFASGAFVLHQTMPYDIAPGDEYTVIAGCDKRRITCKNTFNNVINFRGFPDVPGRDRIASGKGTA